MVIILLAMNIALNYFHFHGRPIPGIRVSESWKPGEEHKGVVGSVGTKGKGGAIDIVGNGKFGVKLAKELE